MTWQTLLDDDHWPLIEQDLPELADRALMQSRSWRWLRGRILGLLNATPAGLVPIPTDDGYRLIPVPPNRLQSKLIRADGDAADAR